MYADLRGKVALITGAAGNLGRAVAHRLHAEQVKLVLTDRSEEGLRRVAEAIGAALDVFQTVVADISEPEEVPALIDKTLHAFGRLDILVNVAGGFRMASVLDMAPLDWEALFNLNTKTAFLTSAAAARAMKSTETRGRIINIGARAALAGGPGLAAYSASKAAVLRLTESMAAELLEDRITVNAVLPSTLDTPANRQAMPDADPGAWVSPASLAEVIAFLASEAARDISGAAIPVYGRA